jgi:hypothetical protein
MVVDGIDLDLGLSSDAVRDALIGLLPADRLARNQ